MFKKKRWSEMGPLQRIAVVILSMIQVGLLAAALWDIRRRSDEEINGSKALWSSVVFINFVGPIAYFSFGRKSS